MHLVYVDESGDDGFAKSGIYTKSTTHLHSLRELQ